MDGCALFTDVKSALKISAGFISCVAALLWTFYGEKKVSMLYFLIMEHLCTESPTTPPMFPSSSSTLIFALSLSLKILICFPKLRLLLKETLLLLPTALELFAALSFDNLWSWLTRLTLAFYWFTRRFEARRSIEDLFPAGNLEASESRKFDFLRPLVIDPGENLCIVPTLRALMLIFLEISSSNSSSLRSVFSSGSKSPCTSSALISNVLFSVTPWFAIFVASSIIFCWHWSIDFLSGYGSYQIKLGRC